MINIQTPSEEERIKAIASFLRLPQRLVKFAKTNDAWLYSFMKEIYLNGDEEKRIECFGDTKSSAKESFLKYIERYFRDRRKEIFTAYEAFSGHHSEFVHIYKNSKKPQ